MANAKVLVDDTRAVAKLNRAYNKILKQTVVSTKELMKFGAEFAKQIVPYDTGQTWKAIKVSTKPVVRGSQGQIYIATVQREDSREFSNAPSKTTMDLVNIMHKWSGSKNHFRSGDPKFMYATRDMLKQTGKSRVIASFKALKFN
jgi:hypothetical protein